MEQWKWTVSFLSILKDSRRVIGQRELLNVFHNSINKAIWGITKTQIRRFSLPMTQCPNPLHNDRKKMVRNTVRTFLNRYYVFDT